MGIRRVTEMADDLMIEQAALPFHAFPDVVDDPWLTIAAGRGRNDNTDVGAVFRKAPDHDVTRLVFGWIP